MNKSICQKEVLLMKNVDFAYQENLILKDIDFSVYPNEFIGIIGPNGSGKTTLLKLISGILSPQKGIIQVFQKDINIIPRKQMAKMISVVPQEEVMTYDYKVKDVVFMGRIPYINPWRGETISDYQISWDAMEKTDSAGHADKKIHQISGGEMQRVHIARALAQSPKILLLDEFTSHLDLNYKYEIVQILKSILGKDVQCIISVFHDLNLASYCSDRLILLNQGRIETIGKAYEVINRENLRRVFGAKTAHIIQHPKLSIPQVIM